MPTTERLRAPAPTTELERGLADLATYGYAIHADFVDGGMLKRLGERIEEQAACERALRVAEYGRRNSDGEGAQTVSFCPNKGRVFIDLLRHPLGVAYAEGVLGSPTFRVFSQDATIAPPRAEPLGTMHIDQQMFTFAASRRHADQCHGGHRRLRRAHGGHAPGAG